jgi:tol-pal system protein YbgF
MSRTIQRIARTSSFAVGVLAIAAGPALSQNREHQQMAAELRMLQVQTVQLGLALAQVTEALQAANARLDASDEVQQRRFANQEALVRELVAEISKIQSRTNDTDIRIRELAEEIDALRDTFLSLPAAITQAITQALSPPAPVDPNAPDQAPAPVSSAEPGPLTPPAIVVTLPDTAGLSPNQMYDRAFSDYSSGAYEVAVAGFGQLVQTFPQSERADDAQYLIGESLVYLSRFGEGIAAYDRVIQGYPTGDQVSMAYFKRGSAQQRLGNVEAARATWEEVVKLHPDSTGARMAAQRLIGLPAPQ